VVTVLLKCMLLVGMTFMAFGPNYAYLLLDMLYGERYSHTEAPTILAAYCFYVALMAINGITEAFTRAASEPKDIRVYNVMLVLFSGIYVCCAVVLIPWYRNIGLIAAECINMGMRIAFCVSFIHRFFGKQRPAVSIRACLPSILVCAVFLFSFVVTHFSESFFFTRADEYSRVYTLRHAATHVGVGCGCLLAICTTLYFTERRFVGEILDLYRHRH